MNLNRHFGFSSSQVKFLVGLAGLTAVIAIYSLIHAYAVPAGEPVDLPILSTDREVYAGAFILDPNSAPLDSLELLPGIGPALAERIVAYRQRHPFETEIDIINVKGIGPRLYEKIRPFLRIRRP